MRGRSLMAAMIAIMVLIALGCSNNGGNPLAPSSGSELTANASQVQPTQTHLWGYYDVYIDIPTQTVTATLNRSVMFSANVVDFVNGSPANLAFNIIATPVLPTYIDVDIDVTIKHPFPGLTMYNGYDVRGVFMGNGSATLKYATPKLKYPKLGTDQFMLNDPDHGDGGGPDGYTRWFNKPEFSTPGLFGYTPGMFAAAGFSPTATLCPYKYFADGLGAHEDAFTWLKGHVSTHGVFAAGAANTRNYYLRFPIPAPNVTYGYAIVADWKGELPADHPANATEAVALSVGVTPDVYYVSAGDNGGDLILDVDCWGWTVQPSTLIVESNIFTANHEFTPSEMTPTGGTDNWSTYHAEIAANNVTSTGGNEFWVIAKYGHYGYTNDYGVTNLAGADALAAFFRYDLYVAPKAYDKPPVCDLQVVTTMPATGLGTCDVSFDASLSSDPDPGDVLAFTWDFNNDGTFGGPEDAYTGPDVTPTHAYPAAYVGPSWVRVTDLYGMHVDCSVDVDVTVKTGKNIPLRPGVVAQDVALNEDSGDLFIIYGDNIVYKYTLAGYYEDPVIWSNNPYGYNAATIYDRHLDKQLNNGGCIGMLNDVPGGYGYNGTILRVSLDPNGNGIAVGAYASPTATIMRWHVPEAYTWHGDPNVNANGCMYTKRDNAGQVSATIERATLAANYTDGAANRHRYFTLEPQTGYNKIGETCVDGIEPGRADNTVWVLQGAPHAPALPGAVPNYWATRFLLYGVGFPGPWDYDYSYFGTGLQDASDNGFYDPKDITRDNANHIFVLDTNPPFGIARVKVWNDPDPLVMPVSIGHFGDVDSISSSPLRIEGCNYNGNIVVLHGGGTAYFISVFLPADMPF